MGIRLKRIHNPPGADCYWCTVPQGPLFEPGETPKYIWAFFWDIIFCPGFLGPGPQNIPLRLEQNAGVPCAYQGTFLYGFTFYTVHLNLSPSPTGESTLALHKKLDNAFFSGRHVRCPPEYAIFVNDYTYCTGTRYGRGGYGIISWHKKVTEIIDYLGLTPGPKLFLEEFPGPDGTVVSKFCHKPDATNIKIKHEV